jgi:metal-sulfur cluster biosynthetic enzyme
MNDASLAIPDEAIRAEAWDRLTEVYDPEIGINLVDLGLIYALSVDEGVLRVEMSLTTPGCPMSGVMPDAVGRALETIPGVTLVQVNLVWEPAWQPERMSDKAKRELGWK